MDDRHNEVLATATLFFVLTWLTVSLRVYVRGFMKKTWGKDDTFMVATLLVFTVYLAFQIVGALHGTGRHRWDLSDEDAKIGLMFCYLDELLYVFVNCLLKFAIGYFYLRVAIQRWHIWVIRILMAGTIFFGVVYFFLVMLQCIPVAEFWNNHPASSKCMPDGATLGVTYAIAAANAAADWTFGTLPFFIVWDMQMKLKTKILVAGILAFAAIGSTGTVVRMTYIHTLVDGSDFLWATTDVAIWSTVEPGIGIIAGSVATLRPLVRQCLRRVGLAATPYDYDSRSRTYILPSHEQKLRDRRGYRRSLGHSDLVPTEMSGTTSTSICGPENGVYHEMITPPDTVEPKEIPTPHGGIMQTVSLNQECEGPPKIQLRNSLRNSFTRDSILSPGMFKVPG